MAALTSNLTDDRFGDLEAGWSVSESATPHDISGQPASTGSVSYSAAAFDGESQFVIDRQSTLSRPDLGSIVGNIDGSAHDNLRVQLSQGSILTKLNVDLPDAAATQGGTWALSVHFTRAVNAILPTATVSFTAAGNPNVTTPLWRGNVWDHLNQLASAYKLEIATAGTTVVIRDIGSTTLVMDEFDTSSKAKVSVGTQQAGQAIEVVYYQSTQATNVEVYNAFHTGNQVFQADYLETSTVSVTTNTYFQSLVQPTPINVPKPLHVPVLTLGAYCITAADNLPIPAALWTKYGGKVTVAIGSAPNILDVTVVGPQYRMPGYAGPYRLALSDGKSDYATLSIKGTGIVTNPQTLTIPTGADPATATKGVSTRVDNIFISSLAQAYDRGVWAAESAAGPIVTLSATVPTAYLPGFGLTAGCLFPYGNSIYRIMAATIGPVQTSIVATRFVKSGDEANAWAGQTAGAAAAYWAGTTAGQVIVEPLRVT